MTLSKLSNNDLWERWKAAIDDWLEDQVSASKKRKMDRLEDEIIRRMKEASKSSLKLR